MYIHIPTSFCGARLLTYLAMSWTQSAGEFISPHTGPRSSFPVSYAKIVGSSAKVRLLYWFLWVTIVLI